MSTIRRYSLLFWILMPLMVGAQDSDEKVHDAGIGFSFSSGQSLFFIRSTNPFRTNHTYLTAGFHIEEEGIGVTYYNYTWGTYERRAKQRYYLEMGWGWRHLWFRESMAGGFLPHSVIEAGASGYIARLGRLRYYFQEATLHWEPYLQAGLGASIHTGTAIYRIEMGYLSTFSFFSGSLFPGYGGVYLKVVISSGQKPR
ncbi:MAG: hypothetical protein JSU77_05180 [Fidelibacterota bacterium]|nr:MAG: hypothetical protein JSU77_05180 [Candidatus Neomarinimicrobiota bacterium]